MLEISRGRVIVKERLPVKEQKQPNTIRSSFQTNYEKVISSIMFNPEFPEQLQAQEFNKYLFPSRKGADTPLTRQSLWRIIHRSGNGGWVEKIGPHSMRKTFGYFFSQARNQNRDHSVATQPFFTTGDLTLCWDPRRGQRYRRKEFGSMTE